MAGGVLAAVELAVLLLLLVVVVVLAGTAQVARATNCSRLNVTDSDDWSWDELSSGPFATGGASGLFTTRNDSGATTFVMFGGQVDFSRLTTTTPTPVDGDVYEYHVDTTQTWNERTAYNFEGKPGPRAHFGSFEIGGSLYVVHGQGKSATKSDVWRLDIDAFEDAAVDASSWRPVDTSGSGPSASYALASDVMYRDPMNATIYAAVFGGLDSNGDTQANTAYILQFIYTGTYGSCNASVLPVGDNCEAYQLRKADQDAVWWTATLDASSPTPDARAFHAATSLQEVAPGCTFFHGGISDADQTTFYADLWTLCSLSGMVDETVSSTTFNWTRISPTPSILADSSNVPPLARFGHAMTSVTHGRLAIVGGSAEDSSNLYLDDMYEYDYALARWIAVEPVDTSTPGTKRFITVSGTNGTVLLHGGQDVFGTSSELFTINYEGGLCTAGYALAYCPYSDGFVCNLCTAGTFAKANSRACTDCPAGTYAEANASASCESCLAGTYSATVAASSASTCLECGAGTFSDVEGATSSATCASCPTGSVAGTGSTNCTACTAGTRIADTLDECVNCLAGTFSGDAADSCTNCSAGTFSPDDGASSCLSCGPGTYSLDAATACTACEVGTYQPDKGASNGADSCLSCPTGTYNAVEGAADCTNCLAGYASSVVGATNVSVCEICGLGLFSASGAANCTVCPAGTWSNETGAASCTSCGSGRYSPAEGATNSSTCRECPSGSETLTIGAASQDECIRCQAGKHALTDELGGGCNECPRGRYTGSEDMAAAYNCTACPERTYAPKTGSQNCTACPTQQVSQPGSFACVNCSSINASCILGPNAKQCSNNGVCNSGLCICDAGWTRSDCSDFRSAGGSTGALGRGDGLFGFDTSATTVSLVESAVLELNVTRTLGAETGINITIDVNTSLTNATAGQDYDPSVLPITLYFAPGITELPVSSSSLILDDSERNENCKVLNLVILNSSSNPNDGEPVRHRGAQRLTASVDVYIDDDDFVSVITSQSAPGSVVQGALSPNESEVAVGATKLSMDVSANTPQAFNDTWGLDVLFAIDVSQSMSTELGALRDGMSVIVSNLQATFTDIQYGLVTFSDKSVSPHGNGSDYEYSLDEALSSSSSALISAVEALHSLGDDSLDSDGSQLSALFYALAQEDEVGWRTESTKAIVMVTDSAYNEQGDLSGGSANNLDAVLDDGEDYVAVEDVWALLHELCVTPVFVVGSSSVASTTYSPLVATSSFAALASTGGAFGVGVVQALSGSGTSAMTSAVKTAMRAVRQQVHLCVVNDAQGYVSDVSPSKYDDVSSASSVLFNVTLSKSPTVAQSVELGYHGAQAFIDVSRSLSTIMCNDVAATVYKDTTTSPQRWYDSSGMLQAFWPDEEHVTLWDIQASEGMSYSFTTTSGPFGDSVPQLVLSATDPAAWFKASFYVELSYLNMVPFILHSFVKTQDVSILGGNASVSGNLTLSLDLEFVDDSSEEEALVINFDEGTHDWQSVFDTYYTLVGVDVATTRLSFSGSGTVSFASVGLYVRPNEACQCRDGRYFKSNTTASRLCEPQRACRFNMTNAECFYCAAGSICLGGIQRSCTGTDFSFGGQTSCSECNDGWLCENGLTAPCGVLGKVSSENGTACVACPEGHWCRNGVAYECLPGKWSPGGTHATECPICEPGTFNNRNASTNCTACPAGTTSNYGRTGCSDCPAGTYSSTPGQHPCTACEPGRYSSGGQTSCTDCDFGTYTERAAAVCADCPQGTNTTSQGSTSISDCT